MAILKNDGIVLKSIPYGESSKIVTILTKEHGKVTMLARGARDVKSKFGGSLELFSRINMIYYEKETRDIQYLSEAAVIDHYFEIRNRPERLFAAMTVLEIANRAVHGNEDSTAVYELVARTLTALDKKDKPVQNAVLYYLAQMSALLGFRIEAEHCPHCPDILNHRRHEFLIENGRVICEECPDSLPQFRYPISKESIGVLRQLSRPRVNGTENLVISPSARQELFDILLNHLQYHVEEIRQLNTTTFLKI